MQTTVGIEELGVYTPDRFMSAKEIAELSGIPEEILIEKFGIKGKRIAADNEHITDMAAAAAKPILEKVDPLEIDVLIYFGSPHRDYQIWPCAPRIQHLLGTTNAYCFEIMNVSSCCPIAMKVAKDMLLADSKINKILLVGASKESTVIDYQNKRSRFMYNFGDGGAAVLLTKNNKKNQVLEAAVITDGSFHDCVMVPAGGTAMPSSVQTIEAGKHYIDVINPKSMKERLDPVTLPNFLKVIEGSVKKSGYNIGDINFVAPWHTKRSMFKQLVSSIGLAEENTFYLEERGHMSAIDPIVVLEEGIKKGRVKDQGLVVLVSAGTGYTWSAISIRWGGNA